MTPKKSEPKVISEKIWIDGKGRVRVTREIEHQVEVRVELSDDEVREIAEACKR